MTMTLDLLLLILSLICLVLASAGVSSRINFTAAGLALFVASIIF